MNFKHETETWKLQLFSRSKPLIVKSSQQNFHNKVLLSKSDFSLQNEGSQRNLPATIAPSTDVMVKFDIKYYIQADSGFRFSLFSSLDFVVCSYQLPCTYGTKRTQCPLKWLCNSSPVPKYHYERYCWIIFCSGI